MANRGKAGTAEEIADDSPMFQYGGVVPDGESDAVEATGIQAGKKRAGKASMGAYVEFEIIILIPN
jgi:hypothetical protein